MASADWKAEPTEHGDLYSQSSSATLGGATSQRVSTTRLMELVSWH